MRSGCRGRRRGAGSTAERGSRVLRHSRRDTTTSTGRSVLAATVTPPETESIGRHTGCSGWEARGLLNTARRSGEERGPVSKYEHIAPTRAGRKRCSETSLHRCSGRAARATPSVVAPLLAVLARGGPADISLGGSRRVTARVVAHRWSPRPRLLETPCQRQWSLTTRSCRRSPERNHPREGRVSAHMFTAGRSRG